MLAQLRSSAYPIYQAPGLPPAGIDSPITYDANVARIEQRKREI